MTGHSISFDGHYVGDNLSVKFTDEVLEGVVTLDASTTYSPLKEFNSVVEGKLLLTSLKIKKKMLQDLIYHGQEEPPKTAVEKDEKSEAAPPLRKTQTLFPLISSWKGSIFF